MQFIKWKLTPSGFGTCQPYTDCCFLHPKLKVLKQKKKRKKSYVKKFSMLIPPALPTTLKPLFLECWNSHTFFPFPTICKFSLLFSIRIMLLRILFTCVSWIFLELFESDFGDVLVAVLSHPDILLFPFSIFFFFYYNPAFPAGRKFKSFGSKLMLWPRHSLGGDEGTI